MEMKDILENLWPIILIIIGIASAIRSAKKKAARKAGQPDPGAPAPVKAQQAAPQKPAQTTMLPRQIPRIDDRPAHSVMQPTIHVTEHDHTNMFEGSLGDVADEGYDPHDHGFTGKHEMPSEHSDERLNASFGEPAKQPRPALALDFGPSAITQGIILQEVLKRPCERRR